LNGKKCYHTTGRSSSGAVFVFRAMCYDATRARTATMNEFHYISENESTTAKLGAALAEALPDGANVSLNATLGAGKTRLVQAIAEAVGVDRSDVISPTFVLIKEYHARRTIYHMDAYRLKDEDEFDELGPDEYFESDGLVLIEWADRVEASLPPDRLDIRIDITGEDSREFAITAIGSRYEETVAKLASLLSD